MSLNVRRLITWSTTLTVKTVLKVYHRLWTDFLKYNFVLDWHVHWYVCTAVYGLISFIIVSWYWYVTVFGLPVILSQILPYGLAPNIFFVSNSSLSAEEPGVVVTWKVATEHFYFLTQKIWLQYPSIKTCTWYSLLTDLSVLHKQMTCFRSLSSLMFGDNIYVGYVLKVPPVSYFLYIK